jgi:hypothetical protein
VITKSPVEPAPDAAGVATIGRYTVEGSVLQVTDTLVTLSVAVPEPFDTAHVGPDGCVRMVIA